MGDKIDNLPTDNIQPSTDEKEILKWMYGEPEKIVPIQGKSLWNEFKIILTAVLLFILFSLPIQWPEMICKKLLPISTNSAYILLLVKGLFFGLCLWIVCNARYLFLRKNPVQT